MSAQKKNPPLGEEGGELERAVNSYLEDTTSENDCQDSVILRLKKRESEHNDLVQRSMENTMKALIADLDTRPPKQEGMFFCKTCHCFRWCIAKYCQECQERWEGRTFGQRLTGAIL